MPRPSSRPGSDLIQQIRRNSSGLRRERRRRRNAWCPASVCRLLAWQRQSRAWCSKTTSLTPPPIFPHLAIGEFDRGFRGFAPPHPRHPRIQLDEAGASKSFGSRERPAGHHSLAVSPLLFVRRRRRHDDELLCIGLDSSLRLLLR